MLTPLPHRLCAAVAAPALTAALLVVLAACAGPGAAERGGRPPWLTARAAAQGGAAAPRGALAADAGTWSAAAAAAAAVDGGGAPLPRLKPPPERRSATLLAEGRHLVLPGDTLSELAERYGLPARELARRNGIEPPYAVKVGQVLDVGPPRVAAAATATAAPAVHMVRPGESLIGLAHRYGVALGDLARANGLRHDDRIRTGQELRIPGAAGDDPSAGVVAPAWRPGGGEGAVPEDAGGDGFVWPVRGEIVSTFGLKLSGRRNDGVNIAARGGTPVRAAAAGVVIYVGDALRGYGRMVLLRHPGGYTTAYAHNSAVLVDPGQRVARGEVIARVGTTGSVKDPQLHFELRREGQALDPLRHLVDRGAATTLASSGG